MCLIFPQQIFLYRNALDTVDSFCMAFFDSAFNRFIRYFRLDSKFLATPPMQDVMATFAPLVTDSRFSAAAVYDLGFLGLVSLGWVSSIDSAIKCRAYFSASLRYEDLIVAKEALVISLLQKCGFAVDAAALKGMNLDTVFASDAHGEAAKTTSKRFKSGAGRLYLKAADVPIIESLIASHETIRTGDYILGGTLSAI